MSTLNWKQRHVATSKDYAVRYLYNAEGFPIYNQAHLYSGFTKEKKVRTPEEVTYNFSWNLDTPIWDGNHVECYIMKVLYH